MDHSTTEFEDKETNRKPDGVLKRGWTTGACATAATKAALTALFTGTFPDPVRIRLPKGETPDFPLAHEKTDISSAEAGIVKDAGDDPDVTHGALVISKVTRAESGSGIIFRAGHGVGTITKPGLPIPVGEAAINPVPRQLMTDVIVELCQTYNQPCDITVEISIPKGEQLARKTWNPRLGIVGGLSILGTTGIVHPFSCSAWIHSIHRGIDVARAEGLCHVAGNTGSTSEASVQALYNLPDHAMLDMGDFVGGMLKYLRAHPVPRVTIGGGFAKLTKLAQGYLDLHSGRSQVDFEWLCEKASQAGFPEAGQTIRHANTAQHAREIGLEAGFDLAPLVADHALQKAQDVLRDAPVQLDIVVVDRKGQIIARKGDYA